MTLARSARAFVATSLVTVLALVGSSTGIESETTPSASTAPSATPAPTEGDDRAGIAPPVAPEAATLPSGIDPDSDTALVWEALMSPVGEYASAASYLAVLDRFGMVEPYATILEGELRHIDALSRQLDRAGVDVPENPYIGVVVAPDNLQTAAEAWAVGEIDNVAMYDELLAKADGDRLVTVLGNLRRASLESHLPLFEAAAAAGGTLDELPAHTR